MLGHGIYMKSTACVCTSFYRCLPPDKYNDGRDNSNEEHQGPESCQCDHGTDVQPRARGLSTLAVDSRRNVHPRRLLRPDVVTATEYLAISEWGFDRYVYRIYTL